MGRSQETFQKKDVRNKKEKKRKAKEERRAAKKEKGKSSLDDMIAYVDDQGNITAEPPDPSEKEEINAEDIELSPPKRDDLPDMDTERNGTVTFFNESKGYGFIRDSETKQDYFVHINDVAGEIAEGNAVIFTVGKGQKGPAAFNVRLNK
jgi:cold shock CspA family protein